MEEMETEFKVSPNLLEMSKKIDEHTVRIVDVMKQSE